MVSALIPLTGFMIAIFVLYESPAYLIRAGRTEEAFRIVRFIYSMNMGKPKESFPVSMELVDVDFMFLCYDHHMVVQQHQQQHTDITTILTISG